MVNSYQYNDNHTGLVYSTEIHVDKSAIIVNSTRGHSVSVVMPKDELIRLCKEILADHDSEPEPYTPLFRYNADGSPHIPREVEMRMRCVEAASRAVGGREGTIGTARAFYDFVEGE